MSNNPLVSVCIPVYNAVKYIEQTLNCFLNQTYSNIEIIVSDDCSTDGTLEKLEKFKDHEKITILKNSKNTGIGPNWNNAYNKAKGKYIVIANADDIHFSNFIEKAVNNILLNDVDFVSFKYEICFDNGSLNKKASIYQPSDSQIIDNSFDLILLYNPFHIIFTMFKKELIDQCLFDKKMFINTQVCDYEFLLRYSYSHPKMYFNSTIIGYYRIHETNVSSRPLAEFKSFYFDVMPLWCDKIVKYDSNKFHKFCRNNLFNYIKKLLRRRDPFDFWLLFSLIKYYLFSVSK